MTDVLVVLTDRLHKSGLSKGKKRKKRKGKREKGKGKREKGKGKERRLKQSTNHPLPPHQKGFKLQSQILQAMITVVESGQVQVPLFDPSTNPPGMTNQTYLRQFLSKLLTEGFPILNRLVVVVVIVDGYGW